MMAQPPAREPSIRTDERPMAFTGEELGAGALRTWILFCALVACGILAAMLWNLPGSTIGSWSEITFQMISAVAIGSGVVALVALLLLPVGLMLTWPIASLLRRVRRLRVHIAVYTLLGGAIGGIYLAVSRAVEAIGAVPSYTILLLTPAVAITVATPLGWWLTARRALRKDVGLLPSGDVDEDAAVEDSATS